VVAADLAPFQLCSGMGGMLVTVFCKARISHFVSCFTMTIVMIP
jgi:hypothetical protein